MGGKSKQRVKNNARPSSSSRSAELLGSTAFVGFAAHADLGIVPLVPGFSSIEIAPETFDANISSEFQLVLRKMSKKDPMTKKKALQEFIDLVNTSELEANKSILPLWPKFYHTLATDTEHIVRELAQTALRTLVCKCKRAAAPFLKQLVPVWVQSRFDNYAPAASIAVASFRETFAGNADRTQEVLVHCQTEIVEYALRNLTFHTPDTLSNGKSLAPEEAEQKYQRAVVGSLKMLSFYIENTYNAPEDAAKVVDNMAKLVSHQKFWSFAKHKTPIVRAAWFEFACQLLRCPHFMQILTAEKNQLIALSFQNIDESDANVASNAWGCVLQIQANYTDWYTIINLKKTILPKLSRLLRNSFNRNAKAICPNLLPFFSQISTKTLQDESYDEFCRQFFTDLKASIIVEEPQSKAEANVIIKSYFECLRYLLQKLHNMTDRTVEYDSLAKWLLLENVITSIVWFMINTSTSVKCYFQQTSSLIAFLSSRCDVASDQSLFAQLLSIFWHRIFSIITESMENNDVLEMHLEHAVELVRSLYAANPNFEEQKIKFSDDDKLPVLEVEQNDSMDSKEAGKSAPPNERVRAEVKKLVILLVRLFLRNVDSGKSPKYIKYIRSLTKLFPDDDFYKSLSTEETILATLMTFKDLCEAVQEDEESCESIVDVIFDILQCLEPAEGLDYVKTHLLMDSKKNVKKLILQRLLSYPFCNEVNVRPILAQPAISATIIGIAREALSVDEKADFNILYKCFYQVDSGEILIDQKTVDGILELFCEALFAVDRRDVVDVCCSFLAQTMPVLCGGGNVASKSMKLKVFLRLFEFSMKHLESNDFISEETLWEIATCWQDALSAGDISMDDDLLASCGDIVQNSTESLLPSNVEMMADALSKLTICSTEKLTLKSERLAEIERISCRLFYSKTIKSETVDAFKDQCTLLEASKCLASAGSTQLTKNCLESVDMETIFRCTLLNLVTIKNLIRNDRKVGSEEQEEENETDGVHGDKNSEDILTKWPDQMLSTLMTSIEIAAAADSIVSNNLYDLSDAAEQFALTLAETAKLILSIDSEMVGTLVEHLLQNASTEMRIASCRAIKLLVYSSGYSQFEENATIVLNEALSDRFVGQNVLKTYVCSLQYLLPNLSPKAITMQHAIMSCDPRDMWVKAAMFRCLISNNFDNVTTNETDDKTIVLASLQFITDITEKKQADKQSLLYNTEVHGRPFNTAVDVMEYINLFCELVEKFAHQLTLKNWDALRLGLSSWTLSASKSISNYTDPTVFLFVVRVFKLYETLKRFIITEKQKSSTEMITNVIEEWQSVFAREVDLVLFKVFCKLCDESELTIDANCYALLMEQVTSAVELIDYDFVYSANKELNRLDSLCNFLLKNLSNSIHCIRTCCAHALRQMTKYFVAADVLTLESKSESLDGQFPDLHFLNRFEDYLTRYGLPICKYLDEFSFKLTEINNFGAIDRNEALSYLMLWDCIIFVCANSPVTLRSTYTNWLHENKYEENLLHFLFRAMPAELLRNHDSRTINNDIFKSLTDSKIKNPNLSIEKYAFYMYTEVLRKLPAMVRKWWNTCPSRQKTFVDKFTTNFVSSLICNEELKTIAGRKDKHENMQVTVHNSTREVLAVYSIDEACMELVITLAPNYPLGAVKVECGKQIGGRSSSRNIGMQLSIFLTHQNGNICDGLTLWKSNLDKKFAGVEECYICYTVIHQDTCQLPKLSCKTCKKKFHGPCLHKWFTTSGKSTCPICRNVF